jgi:hypothetical protein
MARRTPRHQSLQRVGGTARRLVAPQVVDERRYRDRTPGVEREPGQQPAQPQAAERDGLAPRPVRPHLDRAEQPDPHPVSLPTEIEPVWHHAAHTWHHSQLT